MHTETDGADTLDVSRVGPRQILMLAIGALVLISDGFDAQVLSVAGPDLSAAWRLPRGALAPVFAANLAGLMVGALLITPLTDLFSRKRVIAGCIVAFGLLSLLTVWTSSLAELEALRFITGLAIGSEWSTGIALVAETWPNKARPKGCGFLQSGFGGGAVLAAIVWAVLASSTRSLV